jgi:hypothetical protein
MKYLPLSNSPNCDRIRNPRQDDPGKAWIFRGELFSHFSAFTRILNSVNTFRFSSRFELRRPVGVSASRLIADEELLVDPSQTTVLIMTALGTFTGQRWRIPEHRLLDTRPMASSRRARHGVR